MTVANAVPATPVESGVTSRLLVTQRDPATRGYKALGFLSAEEGGSYSFAYLRSALMTPDFVPLPGLSRTDGPSRSTSLFPLFAERVISPRRPDRPQAMHALGLPLDAAPFEVLVRSAGRRVEDHIELLPVPYVTDEGHVRLDFLAHGVRYMSPEGQRRISELSVGDSLTIRNEPSNPKNPRALLVADSGDVALGYVPEPLVEVVHGIRDLRASVLRANGPEVGFHMRLLVRVEGHTEVQPFVGPEWATVAD